MWNLRNTGAMLARWCNDHVKATPHRVVATHRERYSIAFFCDPDKDIPKNSRTSGGLTLVTTTPPMVSEWGICFFRISVCCFLFGHWGVLLCYWCGTLDNIPVRLNPEIWIPKILMWNTPETFWNPTRYLNTSRFWTEASFQTIISYHFSIHVKFPGCNSFQFQQFGGASMMFVTFQNVVTLTISLIDFIFYRPDRWCRIL